MRLSPVEVFADSNVNDGLYLVILHAGRIPPHLGLLHQGLYYSSAAHKSYVAEPSAVLLKTIHLKSIPTLLVRLEVEISANEMKEIFLCQGMLKTGETCLNPIRKVLKANEVNFVFELLDRLQKRESLKGFYGLNLATNADNSFDLPHYTLQDVYLRIHELRIKYAQ
ncbi:MAG: hypothetical protein ACK4K0_03420 [Flavobacteriales bacterium]